MSTGPINAGSGGYGSSTPVSKDDPVVVSFLVILTVVCATIWFYYWCSPICRSMCRRWRCCCRLEPDNCTDSESGAFASRSSAATTSRSGLQNIHHPVMGTPTLILLPHGRMLVVDGTIFAQLRAENTGLDLVELGESVMRNTPSQCSVIEMDAETPSKDSMGSIGCFPPPTYESIYGKEEGDGPPSYSDILLHRYANLLELEMQHRRNSKEEIELRSLDNCPHIINNPMSAAGTTSGYNPYPSSQSLPRNPSLIANPLDAYHVDNEMLHRPRQQRRTRRTRRTSFNGVEDADIARQRRRRRRSRAGSEERPAMENYADHRYAHPWDQPTRPQNEFMNSRNIARSESIRSVNIDSLSSVNPSYAMPRRSEDSIDSIEPVMIHHRNVRIDSEEMNWNLNDLDVRYASDEDRPEVRCNAAETSVDEDPDNFKALADIRESRV